jgi:hypothetical protein
LKLKANIKLGPIYHTPEDLQEHGIVLSQDLTKIGFWVGPKLTFLTDPAVTVLQQKGVCEAADEQICIGLQFNSSGDTAASLWRDRSGIKESEGKWEVHIHNLTFDEVFTTASVALRGEPQGLAFHPSENILSVASIGELQIFQMLPDGSVQLLHELAADLIQGPFKVHKIPNGPASPPSTESTAAAAHIISESLLSVP